MRKKITNLLIIVGAFISYTVGAGFASGNEVLQFFGSWGFPESLLAIVGAVITAAVYCGFIFALGRKVDFEKTSEGYLFIGGKALGWFIQIFVIVFIIGDFMIMFAGAGSLLNQQWGLPQWVGAVMLGIISGVVVLGGLKTVENVLGSAGILILCYVLVFAVISLFNPGSSFDQAAEVTGAVAKGQIWQANLFALPPLNWIPGLESLNNPLITGMLYSAMCLVSGFAFYLTLGKRTGSTKQAGVFGVVTAIAFYVCMCLILLILLANFSSLINPETGEMYAFPAMAAVKSIWPSGTWTYVIIIFVGIFTTATGLLWVLKDQFFPEKEMNKKSRIFIIVMLIFGITLGGVLPFSALINFMFSIAGFVGLLMTVCLVVKYFKISRSEKLTKQNNQLN
ncbi:MAG: YkvI family membrane protein [Lachnospiraceae bacterium]